jgi:hypothetical protein
MGKVLRGYAKDKDGNMVLTGTMPIPHSKDQPMPGNGRTKEFGQARCYDLYEGKGF